MKLKMLIFGFAILTAITAWGLASTNLVENRTWTDKTGKHKVQAELVEVKDGVASLKKNDGSMIEIPLEKLSRTDRRWIQRNYSDADKTDKVAAVVVNTNVNAVADSNQWPRWRGPNNDGISNETGLMDSWPKDGPPLKWTATGLGKGYSSIAIANDKIYTMGKKGGKVQLICLKLSDGSELWSTEVGDGNDPNCTPTVDAESKLVFGVSHGGDLLCANSDTGEAIWRKNFGKDFKGRMMSGWGYSESPLVDGDRLICTPGSDKAVITALNKKTGEVIWATPMDGGSAGYASVVISNGGGVKQYITLVGKGLIGVAAEDGKPLWHYPRIANGTANVPTPIVKGDYVFTSSGYGDGGSALLQLQKSGRGVQFKEIYYKSSNELQNHHGGMILIGDDIYMGQGHNNGLPVSFDMKTGRQNWERVRGPGTGSAAIVAADGHLYFRYQDAVMALIEANPQEYKLKGSFKIASRNGESWPHPVIAGKKLYLRDQDQLHCYDIAAQ